MAKFGWGWVLEDSFGNGGGLAGKGFGGLWRIGFLLECGFWFWKKNGFGIFMEYWKVVGIRLVLEIRERVYF